MLTPEKQEQLTNQFDEPEGNYTLLNEQRQNFLFSSKKPEAERYDTEAILGLYTTFTDKMIGIADGSIEDRDIIDPENPERSHQKPDMMIFLDKSARPVSWFMDALWDEFAQEGAPKPEYDFLNIDRTNWFMSQGHKREVSETILGPNDFDIDKVPKEDIARIRAQYVNGTLSEDNWQDEVWAMDTRLDGKNIVIVDEVMNQGGTLSIATQLLKRALPEAVVSGSYFWETERRIVNSATGEQQNDSVPVWYDAKSPWGRGVGDISKDYYDELYRRENTQANLRKKIGWKVLSAPHFNPDTYEVLDDLKAKQLEQDIAFLSYALGDHKLLYNPSNDRDDDEQIEAFAQQGLTSKEAKEWVQDHKTIRKRVQRRNEFFKKAS